MESHETFYVAARKLETFYDGFSLARSLVSILGAGKIGSWAALFLARAGVAQFLIADHAEVERADCLDTAYSWKQLGQQKVHALSDVLRLANPMADPREVVGDLQELSREVLEGIAAASDVLVVAVDDPVVPLAVNDACYGLVPLVFPGFHQRASSGHVIVVERGSPCLRCTLGVEEGHPVEVLQGEHVMPLDIVMLGLATARVVLGLLVGEELQEKESNREFISLRNADGGLHESWTWLSAARSRTCNICRKEE